MTLNRAISVVALAFVLLLSTAAGRAEPAEKPAAHMVAPPEAYAAAYDPLVAEGALRLVAAELAARHGVYARYWSIEESKKIPADAYPRVTVSSVPLPESMPYVRLRRRGEEFTSWGSADGKTYHLMGRSIQKMPRRTYVGVTASAMLGGMRLRATVSNASLNGRPFTDWTRHDYGPTRRPNKIDHENGVFTFRTYGTLIERDFAGTGPLLYNVCDGDFEMDAKVESVPKNTYWKFIGVMCRGGLDRYAPLVATFSDIEDAVMATRTREFREIFRHVTDGSHLLTVTLEKGPDERKEIVRLPVAWWTWRHLVDSIETTADRLVAGLTAELALTPGAPAETVEATEAQKDALAAARGLALEVGSHKILAASLKVDAILDQSPTCPAAHRTAALCGALLACREPFGHFHDRARYLATPVSHSLLAKRLGHARTAEDKLSDAWVMFAVGYPEAAHVILKTLDENDRERPEVKGLTMLITRDYRPLKPEAVFNATKIEQLAWVWALRQCGRKDLAGETPGWLANEAQAPALATIGAHAKLTNVRPPLGLIYARVVEDLLGDKRIPQDQRLSAATKMATALGVEAEGDLPQLTANIVAHAAERGIPTGAYDAVTPFMSLCATATALPVGPVREGDRFRWQSVGPRDHADLARGMVLLALFFQVRFSRTPEVGDALQPLKPAAAYFKAMGLARARDYGGATAILDTHLKTRFARNPATLHSISLGWEHKIHTEYVLLRRTIHASAGRGAWEWMMGAQSGTHVFRAGFRTYVSGLVAREADDYAGPVAASMAWQASNVVPAMPVVARIPYNLSMLNDIASQAMREDQLPQAVEAGRLVIAMVPSDANGYETLAKAYERLGQREKAIEAARDALRNCEQSGTLTRLQARAARLLTELGRLTEALEMGEEAAARGGFAGRKAFADVLAARGDREKATNAYHGLAKDHAKGIYYYVPFLSKNGVAPEAIAQILQGLMAERQWDQQTRAHWAARGFCRGGSIEGLEQAYRGPLFFVAQADQKSYLALCALANRKYDAAVQYLEALEKLRELKSEEVVWGAVAVRLSGKKDHAAWIKAHLQKRYHDTHLRWPIRYALGRLTKEQMLGAIWSIDHQVYAYWMLGIDAEQDNDPAAAVDLYRTAILKQRYQHVAVIPLCRRWAEDLPKKTADRNQDADVPGDSP